MVRNSNPWRGALVGILGASVLFVAVGNAFADDDDLEVRERRGRLHQPNVRLHASALDAVIVIGPVPDDAGPDDDRNPPEWDDANQSQSTGAWVRLFRGFRSLWAR